MRIGECFVGRAAELSLLARRMDAARRGTGGLLLLAGPAGIGKSTLAEEALSRYAEPAGLTVVRGHCPQDSVAPPLWPWQRALRLAGVDDLDRAGTPTGPADAASARFLALARASAALGALAATGLVVLLEDLHWADTLSLDLLHHVAGDTAARGLLIIGTFREPAPEGAAGALANLTRYGATTLRLAPFSADEVAACVGAQAAPAVLRQTDGLPLLVAALRDAADRGTGGADLTSIVSGLLAPLTPAERDIVRAAAVLGTDVDADQLAAVLPGTGEPAFAGALTAAWQAGVLTAEAAEHGWAYRFAHDLVREEVARRVDPAAARRLHRAGAEALARTDPGQAARIAAHWRRAGRDRRTLASAAGWSRRAARQATDRHAYADAARHLADALRDTGTEGLDGAGALLDLAHAEHLAGRADECLRRCEQAAAAARTAGHPDLVAEAALVLQGVTYPQANSVVARLCREALAVPGLTVPVRARLLAQLATALSAADRNAEAARYASTALELAAQCADPRAELAAARARQMTLRHAGETAELLRLGELAVARAEVAGDPIAGAFGHEWRLEAGYLNGRLDIVEDAIAGISGLAERSGLPLARWHELRVRAGRAALEGRFAAAREANCRATELSRASGDLFARAMSYVLALQIGVLRGDADELDPDMWTSFERGPRIPLARASRMTALHLAGPAEEAREAYAEIRAMLPIPDSSTGWTVILLGLVDPIEAYGDVPAAEIVIEQLAEFLPYPGTIGAPTGMVAGTVARDLGRLARVAGRDEDAEKLLSEAIVRNRALGARPYVALACLDLARLLAGRPGALAEAAALAAEARSLAERLDMPGPLAAATALASEIAARRRDADPLTPREREVAALVVRARSNRQIADELVLSERTVESHVRSILAKLRCANRTELATRWAALSATGRPHSPEALLGDYSA
jgi:DNA-binding CsgD family transcriptional regulator